MEDQHIEWKESWRDEYLKWVCAFANAQGGVLEIGRDSKGRVVGLANAACLLGQPSATRACSGWKRIRSRRARCGRRFSTSYADRLRIWNPGELPDSWSVAKLLGPHPSRPFNPSVANAFFRAGEIEAWGRGIQRVFEACREAGAPEPRLQVEPGELWTEFPFSPTHSTDAAFAGPRPQEAKPSRMSAQETTQETTQEQIVAMLGQDPTLTREALASRIGITADGIKDHLGKLRQAGRIRHVGSTKKGRWEILRTDDE
ncbi:MAG: ATP-binding protein [Thermodesulfobacteriota bacterium]